MPTALRAPRAIAQLGHIVSHLFPIQPRCAVLGGISAGFARSKVLISYDPVRLAPSWNPC